MKREGKKNLSLKKIFTYQFRNLSSGEVCFSSGVNLIYGGNGEGKTNLLEAIYLLGRGNSFRAKREEEMIQWEQEGYFIRGVYSSPNTGERTLEIKSLKGKKEALLDKKKMDSFSQLEGLFPLVIFVPEDLQLVKGGPSIRRRFLDQEITQMYMGYSEYVKRYQRVLQERNNLLKKEKKDTDLEKVLDEQLTSYGSVIIEKRMQFVERLNPLARLMNRRLSQRKEDLFLQYRSLLKIDRRNSREQIKNMMREEMIRKKKEEIFRGMTLLGPHRDDLDIWVNGKNLRDYGSQGQQRTTALTLKLALLEFYRAERGEYPVLLLDDVFSELDEARCLEIGEVLPERVQSFITTTSPQGFRGKENIDNIFMVDRGSILKEV